GSQPPERDAVVSGLARGRPRGAGRRRPRGPQAAPGAGAVGPRGHGIARGPPGPWLQYRALDPAARRPDDQARDRHQVSPGPCLAPLGGARLDAATSGQTREGTERAGHPALGDDALARGKKNARRRRTWIVFQDACAVSHRSPVRPTSAPRGDTPDLTHTSTQANLYLTAALARHSASRRRGP